MVRDEVDALAGGEFHRGELDRGGGSAFDDDFGEQAATGRDDAGADAVAGLALDGKGAFEAILARTAGCPATDGGGLRQAAGVATLGRQEDEGVFLVRDLRGGGDAVFDAGRHRGEGRRLRLRVVATEAVGPSRRGRGFRRFAEIVKGERGLVGARRAGQDGEIERADLGVVVRLARDLRGQFIGERAAERMVEHPERLLRRRGLVALRHVIVGVREVERAEEGRQVLAVDVAVDRAAGRAERADQVERLAAELGVVESSGHAQHAVAQGFEIEATAMGSPVQRVVGVLGDGVGPEIGGLQESAREDDRADELLHRPALLHERARQMLQQGGVLARRGTDAEVARGLDERLTEEMHPDAVDHHAGGQRVGRARDGVGEVESAAALGELLGRTVGEDREILSGDLLARARRASAEEDDALHGLRLVLQGHRMRRALRARGLEARDVDLQLVAGVAVGDVVGADQRSRRHGRRSAGMEDQVAPGLPLGLGGMLRLAGLGEQGGVGRGQFGQFRRPSIVSRALGTVDIGFIATLIRSTSPLLIPPSVPPARSVLLTIAPAEFFSISS